MERIESRQNETIKHLARLGREKKYRRACGELLCEGETMLEEALASGAAVTAVLVREGAGREELLARAAASGARLLSAPDALVRGVSEVETPQGLVFACKGAGAKADMPLHADHILLLDGLQDPGNLGTVLRTADAFGADAVVLCEGCTDETAPKVIRATMGAFFRVPMVKMPLAEAAEALRAQGLPLYAAALGADSLPLPGADLSRCAVIIGNEARGVSPGGIALADRCVRIPMRGQAESLNAGVAASIFLWEMTKQHD